MDNKLHADMWFPSILWSTMLEDIDNKALVEYANQLRSQDSDGQHHSNRTGYHSNYIENSNNNAYIKLLERINSCVNECAKSVQLGDVKLANIWFMINGKGAYNIPHTHPGSILSGVYYPYAIPGMGAFAFERTDGAEHYLPTVPEPTPFNVGNWHYPSETGKLLIFPSWLRHHVEQNQIDEERVSISFNFSSTGEYQNA